MQNKIFNGINASSKIIILILLILMMFITSSIYLILFISTLALILVVISNKSVKEYVTYIKNIFLFLLFIIIMYIIILREYEILNIILNIYKVFVSSIFFKIMLLNLNFDNLHSMIYEFLKPLKKYIKNLEEVSFEIAISIFYLIRLLNSKTRIKELKKLKIKKKTGIKYTLFPQLILVDNEMKEFRNFLKLNFYQLSKENKNLKSISCVIVVAVIFAITVFKEVIK